MSKIKEILCLHHSHLDIGYTHPSNMLMELQCDYIEQAIDLCLKTADYPEESRFRWTAEAAYPVLKWIKTAEPERIKLFRQLVKDGYISISALPVHTTPGSTAQQLTWYLQQLDEIRELTGSSITTAMNHDVNGQPWTLASLLTDSNIEFYITGINIHFGGIPFPRPYVFQWESPEGRRLPSFIGEHYSLFCQYFFTWENSTKKMHEGVKEYVDRIEKRGWQQDFIYLTATNPPLYDNNCPDANLADLIRRYNEEGHEQVIRFVTPELLYERIKKIENLPVHTGDWTDYWNFGCASTAREVKMNRQAKKLLFQNDFLECIQEKPSSPRHQKITDQAYKNTMLFDEHTWGAAESVGEPDQEETYAQLNHKKEFAYNAADLSAYLVSSQMERLVQNPLQADGQEGILLVNPTGVKIRHELKVPSYMMKQGRTLAALRCKDYLPYERNKKEVHNFGCVAMPPYSVRTIPWHQLADIEGQKAKGCSLSDNELETPFYQVKLHPVTGRILQIREKSTNRKLLSEESQWGFFDLVEERMDERFGKSERATIFSRDVEKGNHSESQWKRDWRAVREGIQEALEYSVKETKETVTLIYRAHGRNVRDMIQQITFSAVHSKIGMEVSFQKEPDNKPGGIYFAFPLKLDMGWKCVYDTAETFVRLDEEQLDNVCRDYVTVDKSISIFDENGGCTLACPDAPMVQVGGFQFGKENKSIKRTENPLLLAWPLNNYWDTNFAASQEGKMTFHYELDIFRKFEEKEAYRIGMEALKSCVLGAAIECEADSEKELLHYESDTSIPVFVRPGNKQDGWLAAVKNFTDAEGRCRISVPGRRICTAGVTDVQGNVKEVLEVSDDGITVFQKGNQLTFVKICLE